MLVGESLLSGVNAASPVVEGNTLELVSAIVLLQSMVVLTVPGMHQKLKHAMKIHVRFMVVGESGLNGTSVQLVVEEQTKEELGYVTILHHNLVEMIALSMVPLIQKRKGATRTLAQLMEDLVTGMNGEHALWSVEVEIKQEQDDATT